MLFHNSNPPNSHLSIPHTHFSSYFYFDNRFEFIMLERQASYFSAVFTLLKTAAFHEIYMESARGDLCRDQNYDPSTAFKSMDSFRHNEIIPYELFSFFDLHRIQSTVEECEEVIRALNKGKSELDWDMFQEMTLPRDTVLRNLALTRFRDVRVEVGTYSRLTYVKEHSEHLIALFMEKQLNFCREFLFLRQEFVRQWGGDVYTMLQKLFKNHKQSRRIYFQDFYDVAREYNIFFNQNEFRSLWRRSKNRKEKIEQFQDEMPLEFEQLLVLLLANDFKTKTRYGLQQNVPIEKSMQRPVPSYKVSHWKQHEEWERKEKQAELVKLEERREGNLWQMKYSFSNPHLMSPGWETKERANQLSQQVDRMSQAQLNRAYTRVTQKRTILRQ